MVSILFPLIGGLGMFLLGMALLTDGLKAFAGSSLRKALGRLTGSPWRAFTAGAAATALVQSSSATTVAVIGFVSAGLITFPQALAVVFGASLGTTGTSWIVSGLGLKISVGLYVLPLIGIGAFMRLGARGRWRELGTALAGFGLIFVGIDALQQGMGQVAESWDLRRLPSTGLLGHLLGMLIGAAMTVLMQSSSGAVATTLTAYHSGAIGFEQASSLVIGAAVGTTVTGVLAAIGAGVPARRTAAAHVLFNLATGLIAIILLPLFLRWVEWSQDRFGLEPGAMSLAAFHTAFIALGVVLFLPWVRGIARLIERLVPDRGPELTRHLDRTVLHVPSMALEASRRALSATAIGWFEWIRAGLVAGREPKRAPDEAELSRALNDIEQFLAQVPNLNHDPNMVPERVAQVHALDHLTRLASRWRQWPGLRETLTDDHMAPAVTSSCHILRLAAGGLAGGQEDDWTSQVGEASRELAERRKNQRSGVLDETAEGRWQPGQALRYLDAMRWLDHICYHCWRASHYLGTEPPADHNGRPAGDDSSPPADDDTDTHPDSHDRPPSTS